MKIELSTKQISRITLIVYLVLFLLSFFLMCMPGGYTPWYCVMGLFALPSIILGPKLYRILGIVALVLSIGLVFYDYQAWKHWHKERDEAIVPTGKEIVQLFDLPENLILDPADDTATGKTQYGNIIWAWTYSNTDHCLFDITIALAEPGSFLSSETGTKLRQIEKELSNETDDGVSQNTEINKITSERTFDQKRELINTVKSNTVDKRSVYDLPLMISPTGSLELTVLTSKEGNFDLMIFIFQDFERDVPTAERMKNPVRLRKSGRDVIEALEEIVYKNP